MKRVAKTGILLTCLALVPAGSARGAEKSRKGARQEKAPASSNASIRSQQRTGDAMEKKVARPTTEGAKRAPADDLKAELAEVERRIRAEDERHAAAVSEHRAAESAATKAGRAKAVANARKAAERERSEHERKRASLDEQRRELRRKLGMSDEPASAPERPSETKSPAA